MFLAFPPIKMELILQGNVNINHSNVRGFYLLAQDNVNGFPHWYQQNGHNAIWYQKSLHSGWTIGLKDFLGQQFHGIIGPIDNIAWPNLIPDGYSYWDGLTWQKSVGSEVTFEHCRYFIFLLMRFLRWKVIFYRHNWYLSILVHVWY